MSKREAEEYITKEHGSTLNTVGDSKVKMATAAQLAKRKMAAPKSRLNRSTSGTPTPTPATNPFSSSGSLFGSTQPAQQQQTFGSIGGMTFGESKSFPPGVAAPGGDFSFSAPGQSSSFTFGQPATNNPFANMTTASGQDNNKSSEDTLMESPQKKPAFGGFGSNSTASTNGGFGTFGGFGQASQPQQQDQPPQQPLFNFGQSKTNGFGSSTSTPLFGQNQTQGTTQSQEANSNTSTLFGQSTTTTPAPVNGLFSSSAPAPSSFNFGQTSAEPQKPLFGFGQSQSQPPTSELVKAPTFSFGQPAQPTQPTEPAQKALQTDSQPATSKFMFGQATTQPPASASTAPATGSSFGSGQEASPQNLFGGFGKPKSDEAPATPSTTSSTADAAVTAVTSSESGKPATTNPFASLFAATAPKADTSSTGTLETSKPVFSFSTPAQSGSSIFGSTKPNNESTTKQPSNEPSSQPLFGFKPTESHQPSLFSPQKPPSMPPSAAVSSPFATEASNNSLKNAGKQDTPTKSSSTFSFGQSAASKPESTPQTKAIGSFSFGSQPVPVTPSTLFGQQGQTESSQLSGAASPVSKSSSKSEQTTPQPKSIASPVLPASKPATPVAAAPVSVTTAASNTVNDPQRTIYSNPPARIPPYLNAEKYKSYDSNYRLHSLNREFQKRIATLDPSREDLENIVRTYVAARESIGESIGLYTRNVAGMKRKGDSLDENEHGISTVKKSKSSDAIALQYTPLQDKPTSSIFQPVSSATKSTLSTAPTSTPANAKPLTPSNSHASSLFKKMIPESNTTPSSGSTSSANPFANLPAPATTTKPSTSASNSTPSIKSSSSTLFKPTMAESTTPPTSPPKKTGFQMPKFAASGSTDFMAAFAQQSEKHAVKALTDAKAKRKAEEFDSDEDDEDEWEKKYEEEERAKRNKIGGIAFKGFTPVFGTPAASTSTDTSNGEDASSGEGEVDDEDDGDDASAEAGDNDDGSEATEAEDNEASETDEPVQSSGPSLFDRISRASNGDPETTPKPAAPSALSNSLIFGNAVNSTPEAPSFSPITPATATPYKPATTFNFTSTPRDSPTPTSGASVFDGGIVRDGPIPGEGLFGSRSNTPVNGERTKTSLFGSLGTPQKSSADDHTWKKGSEIKFGAPVEGPPVNITAPSPVKAGTGFGTLFGTNTSSEGGAAASGSLGFAFGNTPVPGFLGAASHLAPDSAASSRATSPGATDNESVATNETDDAQSDPQNSLMAHSGPYPGEEDEEILFQVRAKVMKSYKEDEVQGTKKQKGWNTEGVGPMRVLKHQKTGKTRMVVRAEPGAHVVLNANLTPQVTYEAKGPNIQFPIFGDKGAVHWLIKVKTPAIAAELAKTLEEHKGSPQ